MTALYGLKSSYYNQMLILTEMEVDDVLKAAFVTNHHWLAIKIAPTDLISGEQVR